MIINPRLAVLYAADQERTVEFLTRTLGFEIIVDVPHGGGNRWVELGVPGSVTSVAVAAVGPEIRAALESAAGRMVHGWFDCDDLDATCSRLEEQGVTFTVAPQPTPWREGGRWAQIAGSDGHLYGLTERLG
ncbi:VOC family protein [Streptomyces sp. NPDC021020]|uniref:VOC family protein n=1 Tax=Streptomyces sp. NPDC021020 TaxID=3365109 RepID=UPI0037A140F6